MILNGTRVDTNSAEYIALTKAMEGDDCAFMDTDTRLVAFTVGETPALAIAAPDADREPRRPVGEDDGEAVLTDWIRALLTRCEVCDE